MKPFPQPPPAEVEAQARLALAEDLFPPAERGGAWPDCHELAQRDPSLRWVRNQAMAMRLVANQAGVLSGRAWFDCCQRLIDPATKIDWHTEEGASFRAGKDLARLEGHSHALLLAERSALNFLQLLSGVATKTRELAQAIEKRQKPVHTRLLDTRKTLPGLRSAQKHAVLCGGGGNHRMGLYDAVMLKDSHRASLLRPDGALAIDAEEWRRWREDFPELEVIIEVEDLATLERILPLKPDRVLLDNIPAEQLAPLLSLARERGIETEASGNIDAEGLQGYIDAGVDFISVGALTKDVKAIDFSLDVVAPSES